LTVVARLFSNAMLTKSDDLKEPGTTAHKVVRDSTGTDGTPVTMRSLLALDISGGLLPCPSALVLLLAAIALHRVGFGLILVTSFSIGLAAVLTAVGLLFIKSSRLLDRVPAFSTASRYTPKHGSWLNMAEIGPSALKGQHLTH
jgi:ABC-type nickel/cobalt efflux system permease component RcnA